jgi:hypothetical protein
MKKETELELTDAEREHLHNLEEKFKHIRDAVRGCVKDYHTGVCLHGEGGTGKSFTVAEELQSLKAKYVLHNSRLTGRGLVDALERAPSDLHVVEDAETLLGDRRAWGVLRSALHSQSKAKPPVRWITWEAWRVYKHFPFTGAIIILSNREISSFAPELRALKTRIPSLRLDVSGSEIRAMMKKIALNGYAYGPDYMAPVECMAVVNHIISRLEGMQRPLDLRLLNQGFHCYLQHKNGDANLHWHVLLDGILQQQILYLGRAEQKAEESRIALEIHKLKNMPIKQKLRLWHDRTGLRQAAYYAALNRNKKR